MNPLALSASETDHESVMPGAVPDVPHDSPEPQTYSTTLGGGDHETANPPQPPGNFSEVPCQLKCRQLAANLDFWAIGSFSSFKS